MALKNYCEGVVKSLYLRKVIIKKAMKINGCLEEYAEKLINIIACNNSKFMILENIESSHYFCIWMIRELLG